MDLYDNSVMDDLIIRGEHARQKRSHKKRSLLKPGELLPNNSNHQLKTEPQQHASSCNWLKEMISYPCTKELSMMESFTLWSALLVYAPIGLYILINPSGSITLTIKDHGLDMVGYQRISGIHTVIIAFLYIIFSRATSTISFKSVILGTTLTRTVYVIACMHLLYIRQYIPLQMVYTTLALDISLAVITLILWFCQFQDASLKAYFKAIWQVIKPSNHPSNSSSSTVQILGFVQCILGLFLFVFPNFALFAFEINPNMIHKYSKGWLSIGFMSSAAIGFIHVLCGGADSRPYNIAVVFYRILFSIPLITYLGYCRQIQFALTQYYVLLDGFCAFVTFLILYRES